MQLKTYFILFYSIANENVFLYLFQSSSSNSIPQNQHHGGAISRASSRHRNPMPPPINANMNNNLPPHQQMPHHQYHQLQTNPSSSSINQMNMMPSFAGSSVTMSIICHNRQWQMPFQSMAPIISQPYERQAS